MPLYGSSTINKVFPILLPTEIHFAMSMFIVIMILDTGYVKYFFDYIFYVYILGHL